MAETPPVATAPDEPRRKKEGRQGGWVFGVILIVVGVAFLLEQGDYIELTSNWWAIFIYLAAFGSFANAWRSYRAEGGFSSGGGSSLTWGLVLTVVASIFLFNLAWDLWWPAILIAIGVGIVVSYLLRSGTAKP